MYLMTTVNVKRLHVSYTAKFVHKMIYWKVEDLPTLYCILICVSVCLYILNYDL